MFSLLFVLVFGACTEEEACAFIGDYSGTFAGDAEGNVDLTVEDAEGVTVVTLTLQNDTLSALGSGEVSCEDGAFVTELTTDAGEVLGTLEGTLDEEGGGEGTWEFTEGDLAGASGTWNLGD